MKRILGVVAVCLAALVCAAHGGDDVKKADKDRLQGAWKVVKMTSGGKEVVDDLVKKLTITVDGEVLSMRLDKNTIAEGKVALDPSKSPKHINITNMAGPDKGQVRLGIYDVQGTTLKLHFFSGTDATSKRPTNFEGDVLVLERSSPAGK